MFDCYPNHIDRVFSLSQLVIKIYVSLIIIDKDPFMEQLSLFYFYT